MSDAGVFPRVVVVLQAWVAFEDGCVAAMFLKKPGDGCERLLKLDPFLGMFVVVEVALEACGEFKARECQKPVGEQLGFLLVPDEDTPIREGG